MLEQLPILIQRRKVPGSRLHIRPIQVKVAVFVEYSYAEL